MMVGAADDVAGVVLEVYRSFVLAATVVVVVVAVVLAVVIGR